MYFKRFGKSPPVDRNVEWEKLYVCLLRVYGVHWPSGTVNNQHSLMFKSKCFGGWKPIWNLSTLSPNTQNWRENFAPVLLFFSCEPPYFTPNRLVQGKKDTLYLMCHYLNPCGKMTESADPQRKLYLWPTVEQLWRWCMLTKPSHPFN